MSVRRSVDPQGVKMRASFTVLLPLVLTGQEYPCCL